jgi:hypothetical protein
MLTKFLITVLTLLLLSGCATTHTQSAAITVKDMGIQVPRNCQYLGDVHGSSLWGGSMGYSLGVENAKNEARDKAAEMGATHIFWNSTTGGMNTSATGNAFLCK